MRRRHVFALLAVALVIALPAASAAAAIKISKIQFDAPGEDDGSNASLNDEYVVIKNTGNRRVTLTGWVLKDRAGHRYTFGSIRLRGGRSVLIHTGSGDDTRRHLYQDSDEYIWNNDGDTAILRDDDGRRVDRCRYSGGARPWPAEHERQIAALCVGSLSR